MIINVTVRLEVEAPDLSMEEVVNEMCYDFYSGIPEAKVKDMEIVDWEEVKE